MNKWEEKIDTSKVSNHIRSDPKKLLPVVRCPKRFCDRVKRSILLNLRRGADTIGFDVITNSRGCYMIVDGTTQIPCTDWHSNYLEALKELRSIVN